MKKMYGVRQLLVALLLVIVGLWSPSNGVDEAIQKTPKEMLLLTALYLLIAFLCLWIMTRVSVTVSWKNQNINPK